MLNKFKKQDSKIFESFLSVMTRYFIQAQLNCIDHNIYFSISYSCQLFLLQRESPGLSNILYLPKLQTLECQQCCHFQTLTKYFCKTNIKNPTFVSIIISIRMSKIWSPQGSIRFIFMVLINVFFFFIVLLFLALYLVLMKEPEM